MHTGDASSSIFFRHCRRSSTIAAVALAAMSLASSVRGGDIQWNGGFSAIWQNVNNWDPFGAPISVHRVPGDTDTANLLTPAGDDVVLEGDTAPINGLIVSNLIDLYTNGFRLQLDNAGSAVTTIAGGANIHVEPRAGGGNSLETDGLFLSGGGLLTLEGGDALVEGNSILGSSSIFSTDGGSIDFGGNLTLIDSNLIFFDPGTAQFSPGAAVSAEDFSIITLVQELNVIDGMTFEVQTGSRLETSSLNMGNDGQGVGSVGSVVVDSGGVPGNDTRVDVASNLTVGHPSDGSGLLHLKSANTAVLGTTTVDATGTIQLEDSSFAAFGALLLDGGTITSTDQDSPIFLDTGVMFTASNDAAVTIDGQQTIRANGTFEFNSGADLTVTAGLIVGTTPSGTGTLIVDGAGSTLDVGGLVIGQDGFTGTVTVANGAMAVANVVDVGSSGMGELTIESAAVLSNTMSHIGRIFGATGTATVTGAGSTWSVSNKLEVGTGGMGSLSVVDDATLEVGATLQIGTSGGVTLDGGAIVAATVDDSLGGAFDFLSGRLSTGVFLGDLANQGGTLAPGGSTAVTTVMGGYTQLAAGILEIELGGTTPGSGHDQLVVTGAAALAGTLAVSELGGFMPSLGQQFEVLGFGSRSGDFASYTGMDVGGFLELRPEFTSNSLFLKTRPAIDGDINLDGMVDIFDINEVSAHWGEMGPAGDANGDGIVDIFDVNLISSNWGASGAAAVPEPSSALIILMGGVILAGCRQGFFERALRCVTANIGHRRTRMRQRRSLVSS